MKKNKILKNTTMLMIYNIAKLVFPFITLPYLTRVFTTETYGTVAYTKTVMNYMQILVDFGFILSATKDIVKFKNNKSEIKNIIGNTLLARIILGIIGLIIVLLLSMIMPILKENIVYTLLSYMVVFLSIFLMDFVFRGLEIMHIITIRFILMKVISTLLTFVLVKNDSNILIIPFLDIVSSIVAIMLVFYELKKLKIKLRITSLKKAFYSIKESFVYFLSNIASISFNALSTILIGLQISTTEVAYWSVCMQIIGSIQAGYGPISDGIYPEMIRTKNYRLIKNVIKIMLPIITAGCIFTFLISGFALKILGGQEYVAATIILQLLVPALFFGFFAIIFGWPCLGSIGKNKEVTISTIVSILTNIILLFILIITNSFSLINIAIVRSFTEIVLFSIRYFYIKKYRNLFVN